MPWRFNPPPNWPAPPADWTPPPGWTPDPAWGPAPDGWQLWIESDEGLDRPRSSRVLVDKRVGGVLVAVTGLVLLVVSGAEAVGGVLVLAGLAALLVGGIGIRRRGVRWARIRSRGMAVVVAAVGGVALAAGTALAGTTTPTEKAANAGGQPATGAGRPVSTVSSSPTTTSSSTTATGPVTPPSSSTQRPVGAAQQAIPDAVAGTALAALVRVRIAGRAPKTGFDRAKFGQAWADVDRNGCDTRNDVLRRDLKSYTIKAGTNGCLVLKGTLHDPYTGQTISFVRGTTTSIAVQIDHVVALSDAWQKGAQQWSLAKRTAFANDSLNLLAVDGPTNARKGDGDAATWLPPLKAYRCAYVARQEAVKLKYGLWMTRAERDATARVLARCPRRPLPTAVAFRLGGGTVQVVPKNKPSPSTTTTSSRLNPRFGTCTEAKRHGYGPYYAGADPEYSWYMDRDHDGVVCE